MENDLDERVYQCYKELMDALALRKIFKTKASVIQAAEKLNRMAAHFERASVRGQIAG